MNSEKTDTDNKIEEATQMADNILNSYDLQNVPESHYDWMTREMMKILHEKCAMQKERENLKKK